MAHAKNKLGINFIDDRTADKTERIGSRDGTFINDNTTEARGSVSGPLLFMKPQEAIRSKVKNILYGKAFVTLQNIHNSNGFDRCIHSNIEGVGNNMGFHRLTTVEDISDVSHMCSKVSNVNNGVAITIYSGSLKKVYIPIRGDFVGYNSEAKIQEGNMGQSRTDRGSVDVRLDVSISIGMAFISTLRTVLVGGSNVVISDDTSVKVSTNNSKLVFNVGDVYCGHIMDGLQVRTIRRNCRRVV